MICKVCHTIEKYGMIKSGDNVTVALSGGADSMCLLNVLLSLKDELGFTVSAAHVNHGIRGAEADRDSEFVEDYCKKNSIRFSICKIDVPAISSETGEGLEECGRRLRYDFLNKTAEGGLIATAHNLNDRIETFFLNFTRGAGLNGLCSIPPVRDNIIRPFIDCSREEIEKFCSENSIPFVTDSTNADTLYSRNRIRHNVLPQLKSINSSFEQSAFRCIESINKDNEYLSLVADNIFKKSESGNCYITTYFKNEHPSIKNRIITAIIKEKTGIVPDSNTVLNVSDIIDNQGSIQISSGVTLRVKGDILDFPVKQVFDDWETECSTGRNHLPFADVDVLSFNKNSSNNTQTGNINRLRYIIDSDKIKGKIIFRNRREGDIFRPLGRNCSKTLKKLFNENHIPPEERNKIIICSDENGIVFVEGFGIDERFAVSDSTQNIIIFIIRRD